MHGTISFSSHLSLAAWFVCCFVSGIYDCPLGGGFFSSRWYSYSSLDSCHYLDFVHVQDQENYPVAGILQVLSVRDPLSVSFPSVDLILPCLAASLTNIQVLPTNDANCRDWF